MKFETHEQHTERNKRLCMSTLVSYVTIMAKFYAVKSGRQPGIYHTWNDCERQVKGFQGARYKSFKTLEDAQKFIGTSLDGTKSNKPNLIISQGTVLPRERATSSKYYAVAIGKTPGVYRSWIECQEQTKGVSKAIYKSFMTEGEALDFVQKNGTRKRKIDDTDADVSTMDDASHTHDLQIYLLFDGGSRGNPGLSGSGSHLKIIRKNKKDDCNPLVKDVNISHYCGSNCTNNIAEYTGLLEGLKQAVIEVESFCKSKPTNVQISVTIKGDSNLIINQMNGVWQIKDLQLKKLHVQCMALVQRMKDKVQSLDGTSTFSISYTHIYRKDNTIADGLANEAMDTKQSWVREVVHL